MNLKKAPNEGGIRVHSITGNALEIFNWQEGECQVYA
jgi:hypothetical protein